MSYTTIDEYIEQFPKEIQEIMKEVRIIIKETIPEAKEKISWQMPTFTLHGNLIHFAANKNHLGVYPGPNAIGAFSEELAEYKTSKGAVQFPYAKPIPYELIVKLLKFSAAENITRAEEKAAKTKEDRN